MYVNGQKIETEPCDYFFGKKAWGTNHLACIKNFYEEKIETGEKNFKCPVFTCPGIFDTGIIKVFVSNEHFNLVDGKVKSLFNLTRKEL